MTITQLAEAIGKGVVAGVAGTAAMTVSSTVEARLRRRAFSTAPADAAAKVLGISSFMMVSVFSGTIRPAAATAAFSAVKTKSRHAVSFAAAASFDCG